MQHEKINSDSNHWDNSGMSKMAMGTINPSKLDGNSSAILGTGYNCVLDKREGDRNVV